MARKKIALNTEPHVVEIGDTELEFLPEVMGDEFVEAFGELKEAQKAASGLDLDDLSTLDPSLIRGAARGMRSFPARLMLPETAELFTRINVVDKAGKVLDSFRDQDEAKAYAEKCVLAQAAPSSANRSRSTPPALPTPVKRAREERRCPGRAGTRYAPIPG
ncbi:hypothetical protein [Streptomyces sp. NPDC051572]|uniref:hypothetical protein n=1 Tax=Streptomyces sp. NPDC051572 TaxID=3155802 RepID=UPI00344BCAFE